MTFNQFKVAVRNLFKVYLVSPNQSANMLSNYHAAGVTCAIIAIVLGLIFLDDPLPTPSTQNQEIKIQDCVVQGKNADNTIDVRCKLQ